MQQLYFKSIPCDVFCHGHDFATFIAKTFDMDDAVYSYGTDTPDHRLSHHHQSLSKLQRRGSLRVRQHGMHLHQSITRFLSNNRETETTTIVLLKEGITFRDSHYTCGKSHLPSFKALEPPTTISIKPTVEKACIKINNKTMNLME